MSSKDNKLFTLSDTVRIAVMAALICVCSWIVVPMPQIPFTMQTFAIFFALEFVGGRNATAAYFVYIFLGCVGVPVFSGFKGGVGHLVGPTGGYLLGFVFSCIIFWIFEKRAANRPLLHILSLALGLLVCYGAGTIWFVMVTKSTFASALMLCVVPYIGPDVVKIALAFLLGRKLKKVIKV